MAKSMELSIVIGAVAGGALTALNNLGKAMSDTGNKYKKLAEKMNKNKAAQNEIKKMEQLTKSYVSAGKEWITAVTKLRKLKEAYDKTGKSNTKLAEKIKQQEKAVEKLNAKKLQEERAFKRAQSAIESEHKSLKQYRETVEKTAKSLERQQKLKRMEENYKKRNESLDKLSSYGDTATKVGAVTGAIVTVPLKIYMDVEESQADLRKILGKEAELYYDKLAEITKNSPLSQVEINEIAGALSQAGIKGNDIVEYTQKAQQMKVAFDMSTQQAGEFLAKTREQLGLGKEELFSYMDTINMMSNRYPVTAEQLAEVSSRTAGFAKNINLAKESNMAFATSIMSTGVNAEQTSTVLNKMYAELAQGANTKAKASALQALGINPSTIEKEMAQNAEGTILKVLERIKNANVADKTGLITDIFGSNASTINGVSTLTNNLDGLKQKLNEVKQGAQGNETVSAEYQERLATLSNQLKIAKNNLMLGLANLGVALAPTVKSLIEQITPLVEKFANWVKENPQLVGSIMKVVGVIAILSGTIAGIITVGVPLLKFVNLLFLGFSKLGVLLAANPIAVVIIAIVAVIAIVVLLYKKCAWFRNFVNGMWKMIANVAVSVWNGIKWTAIAIWNGITAYIKFCINVWKAIFKGIVIIAKAVWNAIKFAAILVWSIIVAYIKVHIAIIKAIFKGILIVAKMVWNGIKASAVATWNNIKTGIRLVKAVFTGDWNTIKSIALGVWNSIKSGFSGMIDSVKSILSGVVKYFSDKFNEIKSKAQNLPLIGGMFGKNYTGTNYWSGGLTTVAERGAEMIKIPGQSPFIAQSEMMMNLPKGTEILNASRTRNTLRDRVNRIKERASSLGSSGSTVVGGDTINITINAGNNSNANDIAREVKRILAEMKNKKERVAFG